MKLWQRLFFQLWYFRRPPWDTGITPPEVVAFIRSHSPGRALDLGCGTGTNVITLAQSGWQVTGVDFAWRAIDIARQKARVAGVNVELLVGDVTDLETIKPAFNFILDIGCFHALPSNGRAAYLHNIERLLAARGSFLLYAFIRTDPQDTGRGLSDTDIINLSRHLKLIERQDGYDRGKRASAWLHMQNLDDR